MAHVHNQHKKKGFFASSFLFHKPSREELVRKGN